MTLVRVRRLAECAVDWLAIGACSGIFLCILAQVILRYVLGSPLTWSEELARYLLVWCALLGFASLFAGIPIWLAMALAGWAFLTLAGIPDLAVAQRIAKSVDSFPLLAAPLFILMGNIMNSSNITSRIFDFAKVCVGWMRGGLCHANIIASVSFAGTSGSAVADAGGLGTLDRGRRRRRRVRARARALHLP